jgi:thiol-disulfide isomerase/thioredoxin
VALVGHQAPSLSGSDIVGRDVSLTNLPKPIVVAFLSIDCPYCRELRPQLEALGQAFPVVVVLSGHGDMAFQSGSALRVLPDTDGAIGEAWGLRAVPTLALVDSEGAVSWLLEGYEEATLAVGQVTAGNLTGRQASEASETVSGTGCDLDSDCEYLNRIVTFGPGETLCSSQSFPFVLGAPIGVNELRMIENNPIFAHLLAEGGWSEFQYNLWRAGYTGESRYGFSMQTGVMEVYHCNESAHTCYLDMLGSIETPCAWGCDWGGTGRCMCRMTEIGYPVCGEDPSYMYTKLQLSTQNPDGTCQTTYIETYRCPYGWSCRTVNNLGTCSLHSSP